MDEVAKSRVEEFLDDSEIPTTPPDNAPYSDVPHTPTDSATYSSIANKSPEHSYTNFVVDRSGLWYCPMCNSPKQSERRWALQARGYKKMPKDYPDSQLKVPSKYPANWETKLYFTNPACVVKCQNQWNEGFSGVPCTFNREEAERVRDPEYEELLDKKRGHILAYCPRCAVPAIVLKKNAKRNDYVQSQRPGVIPTGETPYMLVEKDPWFGNSQYLRPFLYDGTEESLKCNTKQWGAGNEEESEKEPCTGQYGGPVVFWMPDWKDKLKQTKSLVDKVGLVADSDEKLTKALDDYFEGHDKENKERGWFEMDWNPEKPFEEGANDSSENETENVDYDESSDSSPDWKSRDDQPQNVYTSS